MLPARTDTIPELLKHTPQWINWRAGEVKENGKFDKVPVGRNGHPINALNPANWMRFDEAAANHEQYGYGIGFALDGKPIIKNDEGAPLYLIGIDIDNCANTDGVDFLKRTLPRLGRPYVEKSPSGKGIRAFVLSEHPLPRAGANRDGKEMYVAGRYLTLTGHTIGKTSEIPKSTGAVLELFNEWFPNQAEKDTSRVALPGPSAPLAESDPNIDRVKSALGFLSADCDYDSWRNVLFALKSLGWSCGFELADEWSATAPSRYDADSVIKQWNAAKADGGITIGTLFHLAEKAGWVTPAARALECRGDISNGRLFADRNRGRFLYVTERGKWLQWRGTRWEWSESGEEVEAAKAVADHLADLAAKAIKNDPLKGKKIAQHAASSQNINRLKAMVELAASENGMCIGSISQLDASDMLLGVQNGVVDLNTGALLQPAPEMLMTRQAGGAFDLQAGCPQWLKFLADIFEGDHGTIETIQRALGYTLTGSNTEERLFICVGHGANGKSVFGNIVGALLGDYGAVAPSALLTVRRDGDSGPRNDLAMLAGVRLVSINETQSGDRLDEQVVKMLAGREPITTRFLHREFFTYVPHYTPWLRTNHRPIVTGEDEGIWRRLVLIPFRRTFREDERDLNLEQKLIAERDGILMWMLEGTQKWKASGLKLSPTILAESNHYRTESDLLGEFLRDKTQADATKREEQGRVYQCYQQWCCNSGIRPLAKISFTRKLAERGFKSAKSSGRHFYAGLSLIFNQG